MNRVTLRFADPARDAAGVLAVYAPYIEHTAVTFETEVPDEASFRRRMEGIAEGFPYLILEIDGGIAGYAYAQREAERAAYAWNAELSIYLAEEWTGHGLGKPLYALLIDLLAMQGYINLYADITGSNAASIAMHAAMGFEQIGRHVKTGYKFGQWHDTVWLCRRLREGAPGALCGVKELDGQAVRARMDAAQAELARRLNGAGNPRAGDKNTVEAFKKV